MDGYRLTFANIVYQAMDALRESIELRSFCMDTYGKMPAIVNDTDIMRPPIEDECPIVSVMAVGGTNGQYEDIYSRGFIVRVALSDDGVEEVTDDDGRVIWREYLGTKRVSHLLENIIYPVIRERFNSLNFPVSTEDEELETVNMNLFQAKAAMTVQMDKAIGEARPLLG